MNRVAKEPGKDRTAASTQPEATREVRPAGAGEKIGGRVLHSDIGGRDVWLFAGLVVEQEQQAENVYGTDGSQKPCGLLVLSGTQGAADGEGSVKQITEGCTGFQATEVW